ncbi:MAG: RHS repeat domain-containing protein, partial [Bdellovibrionales bacterium]
MAPFSAQGKITGTATFSLSPGYSGNATPLTFSLSSQGQTATHLTGGGPYQTFSFSNGAIAAWLLSSYNSTGLNVLTHSWPGFSVIDSAQLNSDTSFPCYSGCAERDNPGTWSSVAPPAALLVAAKNNGSGAAEDLLPGGSLNNGDCTCPQTAQTVQPNAFEGNPINAATGNKWQMEIDYSAGPSAGLSFTRAYNSYDSYVGQLGTNWHHQWDRSLVVIGGTVNALRPDGRQETFTFVAGTGYTTDADIRDVLVQTSTGWQLKTTNDTIENYSSSGQLTSLVTRNGQSTTLSYDTNKQLQTVTGPFGHTLTFTYDAQGRVSTMKAPDNGVYTYGYDANNNLVSVKYP